MQAQGTQFVLHDEPFYFAGFNAAQVCRRLASLVLHLRAATALWLAPHAIIALPLPLLSQALSWAASNSSQLLDNLQSLFANAAELGLRVGRVFATANGIKVRPPFLDEFDRLQPEVNPQAGPASCGGMLADRLLAGWRRRRSRSGP